MKEIILKKLKEIERKENVKIIYAVESGSRAWGFQSFNSDYDVRFIYVRTYENYLRLDSIKDTINWQLDEIYDINGWDITKALKLLYKSNPTLFEWCYSPIIYKEEDEWKYVKRIIDDYFDKSQTFYHYYSIAKKDYSLIRKQLSLKKYFYILRSLYCCQWILNNNTFPPVKFSKFKFHDPLVNDLLALKMNSLEKEVISRIPQLDHYIEEQLEQFKYIIIEKQKHSYDSLNQTFLNILKVSHL